jgi:predicted TIM-barrel fold metal-dependent hydrolase
MLKRKGGDMMKKIDLENHYYIPELFDYLESRPNASANDSVQVRESFISRKSHLSDMLTDLAGNRIKDMDDTGIDIAVLSSSPMIEELPPDVAVRLAKLSNDAVFEAINKFPGRFMGSSTLPMTDVDEAIKELERCTNELGFKYWHTHSNYFHEHLYDEKFFPVLKKAEELTMPVYIHPIFPDEPGMKDMGNLYSGAGLGFGQDTMRTSLRLILNGTLDKLPNLRIILGHLGEYYPFVLDRMDNRLSVVKDPHFHNQHDISYYFKNKNIFVTTSGNMSKAAFRCTIDAIGIDSILFATDYPYEEVPDMMEFMNSLGLTEEEYAKIYYQNAEKYIFALNQSN